LLDENRIVEVIVERKRKENVLDEVDEAVKEVNRRIVLDEEVNRRIVEVIVERKRKVNRRIFLEEMIVEVIVERKRKENRRIVLQVVERKRIVLEVIVE
jgi:hypothetical protein